MFSRYPTLKPYSKTNIFEKKHTQLSDRRPTQTDLLGLLAQHIHEPHGQTPEMELELELVPTGRLHGLGLLASVGEILARQTRPLLVHAARAHHLVLVAAALQSRRAETRSGRRGRAAGVGLRGHANLSRSARRQGVAQTIRGYSRRRAAGRVASLGPHEQTRR